jgi:hypothetical protein
MSCRRGCRNQWAPRTYRVTDNLGKSPGKETETYLLVMIDTLTSFSSTCAAPVLDIAGFVPARRPSGVRGILVDTSPTWSVGQ